MQGVSEARIGAAEALNAQVETCVACGSALDAQRVRFPGMRLRACARCGSWTFVPRPTPEHQAAIHNDAAYFEHPYFRDRRKVSAAVRRRVDHAMRRIGRAVDVRSLRGKRILDVGCDTGAFVDTAAQLVGAVPVGIDVSAHAVAEATTRGVGAEVSDLEHASAAMRDFALITAIDLIEHVVDPHEFLMSALDRLAPGGVLYIETPNARSAIYRVGAWLCRVTGARPRGVFERLFPAQHIQYFTTAALERLAKQAGFEIALVDRRPLPGVDIATSVPVRLGLGVLQLFDSLSREYVLLCASLRRPAMATADSERTTAA